MPRKILIWLLPVAALCADPNGFRIWKAKELTAAGKRLAPKMDARKAAGENLADFGTHTTAITHREGDGEGEVHAGMTDIFVIQSGGGTVVVGGTLNQPRTVEPGEFRAASIAGGSKHQVGPGDVLHIPAGTAHQVLVPPGKEITYFVIKVAKK